jgi:uncharacterized protein YndB with AHSA1/START domain
MTSTTRDTDTVVRKEIHVAATPDVAFEVFTARFAQWWPGHHLLDGDVADYVLEPRPDGRWYEQTTDGRECEWGRVLVWEPPGRLVLSWAIDARWQADPEHASQVEVTFTPASGGTAVVLEHRHLDRAGDGWRAMRDAVGGDGGWGTILERYGVVVADVAEGDSVR